MSLARRATLALAVAVLLSSLAALPMNHTASSHVGGSGLTADVSQPGVGVTGALSTSVGPKPTGAAPAVDLANGFLYLPSQGPNSVVVLNNSSIVTTIYLPSTFGSVYGLQPVFASYDPVNGLVYVLESNTLGGVVAVIAQNFSVQLIQVGSSPDYAVVDPSTGDLYVLNFNSDFVSVLSGETLVANVTVGLFPMAGVYDPALGEVVIGGRGNISFLSGDSIASSLSTNFTSYGFAYDPINQEIFDAAGAFFLYFNPNGVGFNYYYTPCGCLVGPFFSTVYNPANHLVYGVSDSGLVAIVNGSSNLRIVTVGGEPSGAVYYPVDGQVYVPNLGVWPTFNGNMTILNSTSVVGSIALGDQAYGPCFNPLDNQIFVSLGENETTIGYGLFYNVTVTESGLPQNNSSVPGVFPAPLSPFVLPVTVHKWQASSQLVTLRSVGKSVSFKVPQGSHSISVDTLAGPGGSEFLPSKSSISINVHGRAMLHITFRASYPVVFTETGLPAGSSWTLSGFGYGRVLINSTASTFYVHNGSYLPRTSVPLGYTVSWAPYHRLLVSGQGSTYTLTFAKKLS